MALPTEITATRFNQREYQIQRKNHFEITFDSSMVNSGYAVWGQKTTATQDVYMDRINVSRLVKYVYREVYNISTEFLFEPINESTFTNWGLRVGSLLEDIKTNQGIIDYKYKMDNENNTEATIAENYLIGQVSVRPTEVAEFIDIDFVLTSEV